MHDETRLRRLHRVAQAVVVLAVLVLFLGANVTTTASGDAIPTWPTGLSFASAKEAVEMSHRVAAALAVAATAVLLGVAYAGRSLASPRVKTLAWVAFGMVVLQAVVGGIRIHLPLGVFKVLHASLAQAFFCVATTVAALTSSWWRDTQTRPLEDAGLAALRAALFALALLFVQVVLGALGRHGVLPREVHGVFALVVLLAVTRLVLICASDVPRDVTLLRGPASLLGVLGAFQLVLGIASYIIAEDPATSDPSRRGLFHVVTLNLHLVAASAMLGLTVLLLLRTVRVWGLPTPERVDEAKRLAGAQP